MAHQIISSTNHPIYNILQFTIYYNLQYITIYSFSHSPPLVSFHTIPSRLMLVPGSQGPSDSGSVRVPASAVLEAIWSIEKLFKVNFWIYQMLKCYFYQWESNFPWINSCFLIDKAIWNKILIYFADASKEKLFLADHDLWQYKKMILSFI